MTYDSSRGYRALRAGRYSQASADYFITFCTEGRRPGLTSSETTATAIVSEIRSMESDRVWNTHCAVVMPDHIHLLVQLGEKLSLGRAVARLKGKSGGTLKSQGLKWQAGFHEHRVRSDEDPLPVFIYIYLNPYRAKILEHRAQWPWFICSDEHSKWFLPYLKDGLPEPVWLANLP